MKDLKTLAAECEAELRSLNIQPGEINSWIVNTRAKNRWGQCKRYLPGLFDISISARLLQDSVSDQAAKNTIMHELLHTVKGCYGHRGKWKVLCRSIPSSGQRVPKKRGWNQSEGNALTDTQSNATIAERNIAVKKQASSYSIPTNSGAVFAAIL